MEKLEITGGARIGSANASWPFATFKVNKDKLELNASIVGNLVFQPKDIISIEPYTKFAFIGKGIKINHSIINYDSEVIFWTFQDPMTVINQIRQLGFFDNTNRTSDVTELITIQQQQQIGGFPIKKNIAIGFVVLWNILFLYDFMGSATYDKKAIPIGNGMTIAVVALFLVSILTLKSKDFRTRILKEGKTIEDIKRLLYLIIFISGFMSFGLLITKII
jgi:hypothetical protein